MEPKLVSTSAGLIVWHLMPRSNSAGPGRSSKRPPFRGSWRLRVWTNGAVVDVKGTAQEASLQQAAMEQLELLMQQLTPEAETAEICFVLIPDMYP